MNVECDPQAAADLLKAMAHPMRLAILCRLIDGEVSVSGFESELGLRQPSLSQQLGLLREAGLVAARREAKTVIYALANDRITLLIAALHQYFSADALPQRPSAPTPAPVLAVKTAAAGMCNLAQASECGMFATAGWNLSAPRAAKQRNG